MGDLGARVVGGLGRACSVRLELVEKAIEVGAVVKQAGTLFHGDEAGAPLGVEGAPLDTGVGHRLGVAVSALHQLPPSLGAGSASKNWPRRCWVTRR